MSQTVRKPFELIGEESAPATVAPPPSVDKDQAEAGRRLLFVALQALSKRTLTAVTNLFSLFLVTLTFVLFGRILDDPTPNRLIGVGGFAVFCLLIDLVRRRAR